MNFKLIEKSQKAKTGDGNGIQVISRAAEILRALKNDNSGLSLGQIAERVKLPRSTVQRIVNALVAEGLAAPNKIFGGYQLGPEVTAMALAARHDLLRSLHPILEQLSRETGETVDLATLRANQMVFVDQVVGTQRLRTVSAIGESFPMLDTANGKAVLAMLGDDDIAEIYEMEKSTIAGRTLDMVRKELAEVRSSGYALDRDEHTVGISAAGIAFAIGSAIYAISIPAPTERFKKEQEFLIEKLLAIRLLIGNSFPDTEFSYGSKI